MKSAQKTRSQLIFVLILVAGAVMAFGRRSAAPTLDANIEKPLILRKGVLLSVSDQQPRQSADRPIPDIGEPIDWRAVDEDRRRVDAPPAVRSVPVSRRWTTQSTNPLPQPNPAASQSMAAAPSQEKMEEPRFHRIVEGETLRDLASKYLGSPDRYLEIFYANRAVMPHPDLLPLGARLVIPRSDSSLSTGGPLGQPAVAAPWSSQPTPAKGILLPEIPRP